MALVGSYPVGAFSESKYFLVQNPSTQDVERVLGSELINYITPNLNVVRTETTRATAQTVDYEVGIFVQVAGSALIGDGGSSMLLVVAAGEGDYVMNNGNELLVLPRGSLAGSDLDGALVTDNGVQREIQDAISSRPPEFESFAAIMLEDLSGYDSVATAGFYGGWAGTAASPKGGATYHRDGTTGTASTAYADNSGFYDADGDGWKISSDQDLYVEMFGAYGDWDGSTGTDDTSAIEKFALACNSLQKSMHFGRFGRYLFQPATTIEINVPVYWNDCEINCDGSAPSDGTFDPSDSDVENRAAKCTYLFKFKNASSGAQLSYHQVTYGSAEINSGVDGATTHIQEGAGAIEVDGIRNAYFSPLQIEGFAVPLHVHAANGKAYLNTFDNYTFLRFLTAARLDVGTGSTGNQPNRCLFDHPTFYTEDAGKAYEPYTKRGLDFQCDQCQVDNAHGESIVDNDAGLSTLIHSGSSWGGHRVTAPIIESVQNIMIGANKGTFIVAAKGSSAQSSVSDVITSDDDNYCVMGYSSGTDDNGIVEVGDAYIEQLLLHPNSANTYIRCNAPMRFDAGEGVRFNGTTEHEVRSNGNNLDIYNITADRAAFRFNDQNNFSPATDNTTSSGTNTNKWSTIYCHNIDQDGATGGSGSAGAGNQYIEITINGTTYKVLHDGAV